MNPSALRRMAVPPASLPAIGLTTAAAPGRPAGSKRRRRRSVRAYLAPAAFLGLHLAALAVFFVPITWTAVGLCAAFYVLRVFGLTAGYHRYFAHRGFKATRWFQFVLAWLGASALQRGPIWWAGHHRLHHKHSDTEDDPHSPVIRSIWWAHVGWVLSPNYSDSGWDQMKDWKKYPELRLLERFDVVPGVLLGVFCLLVGGVSGLAWGFLLSTVLVYHVTFLVNSACHLVGGRRFATGDDSRNNWWVALLTFGEGWHNNHHHYPSAARQGFRWWEVDVSFYALKGLSWVGVVWDLREPTPRALAAKPAAPDAEAMARG
ncbi:MAG TPA: acyl-CoA desaturase [Fimbriiglobus sp.]|nr:acyl-CoA desaturase [Fimbriiglobus sp.]